MVIVAKGMYTVKPVGETPDGLMYLSEIGQFVPRTHAPLIFFYRRPYPDSTLNQFETIKHSLGKVLTTFYPLAGRLQYCTSQDSTSSSSKRVEINYNSVGALVVEAESDSVIDNFGDFCPTAAVTELLPPIDYKSLPIDQQPLLLVQFTRFSCGGSSIGLRISHVLIDGTATSHFLAEWAGISRGEELKNPPFLDRRVSSPSEICPGWWQVESEFQNRPLVIGQTNDLEERRKETTPVMLRMSNNQVQILRSNANDNNMGLRPFTSFEVVSAHMWRCACKARAHKSEQQTVIRLGVNFRNRIQPNLPNWYFGNASLSVPATSPAGELLEEPLSHACGKIREAILKVNDEYVKSCLSYIKSLDDPSSLSYSHVVGSEEGPFNGNPNFASNSWRSLSLFGIDFGWGKDIYMGPGLLGFDGKSFTLPDRDGEEGSIVVALRLQVAHMDAFKKFFYADVLKNKLLRSTSFNFFCHQF